MIRSCICKLLLLLLFIISIFSCMSAPFARASCLNADTVAYWPSLLRPARAQVIALHGFGLDKEAFRAVASNLNRSGIDVYAADARGFGAWRKSDSRAIDPEATVDDVAQLTSALKSRHPGCPVFALGESMGGIIALRLAEKFPNCTDGVICCDAGCKVEHQLYFLKRAATGCLTGKVDLSGLPNFCSEDVSVRQAWLQDPNARLSAGLGDLLRYRAFINETRKHLRDLHNEPVLFLQAQGDRLIEPVSTLNMYRQAATPEKLFLMLKNDEHLALERQDPDPVALSAICRFIEAKTSVSVAEAGRGGGTS
jgi:alpha-beta hydrolase superfamily lysophospholipase